MPRMRLHGTPCTYPWISIASPLTSVRSGWAYPSW
ncbi:Uncharacterised protein [Mycobacteroides abscessus subsp. abscessus]|nr:Uncharacterised protein [Mycobacteroides abscessus subsp. abscessus]